MKAKEVVHVPAFTQLCDNGVCPNRNALDGRGLALCSKKIVPCFPLSAQGTGLGFALRLCYQVIVYFWGGCPTVSHHFCTCLFRSHDACTSFSHTVTSQL